MKNSPWSFEEKAEELKKQIAAKAENDTREKWLVPFFGEMHSVSADGVTDSMNEKATPALASALMNWVINSGKETGKQKPPSWISLREYPDAGPLIGQFQENTTKTIERTFEGKSEVLEAISIELGAEVTLNSMGFDMTLKFQALPDLPIMLGFSDQEDGMPATCSMFFPEFSQKVLDIRSLGVIGTWLTGKLISRLK